MNKLILGTVVALALVASVASAQTTVPPITPEDEAAGRSFAQLREQQALLRGLFGNLKLPHGCTLELADPSGDYVRTNLLLFCHTPLSYCDVPGVECSE